MNRRPSWQLLGLLIWLSAACAAPQSKLHPHLEPQGFKPPPSARQIHLKEASLLVLDLKTDAGDLDLLEALWNDGLGQNLDQRQPVSRLSRDEAWMLRLLLAEHLQAHYIWPQGDLDPAELGQALCPALGPRQFDFMSQTDAEEFRNLSGQLLLLSLSELALRRGAEPLYPKVYSAVLRKQAGLKRRISLSELWIPGNLNPIRSQGFWICRR